MPEIRAINVKEHYEIHVNGTFECSCDTGELSETLAEVREKYQ